jgi:hypothetical protein
MAFSRFDWSDQQGVRRDFLSLSSAREPQVHHNYCAPTWHKGAVNAGRPMDGRIALSGGGDDACKVWDLTAPSPANLFAQRGRCVPHAKVAAWLLALVMRSVPCCPPTWSFLRYPLFPRLTPAQVANPREGW